MIKSDFIAVQFGEGKYTLVLSNIRKISGHDDSFPYMADWTINDRYDCDKPIITGKISNDGWGGPARIFSKDMDSAMLYDKELEKSFTITSRRYPSVSIKLGLDEISSVLACMFLENGKSGTLTEGQLFSKLNKEMK